MSLETIPKCKEFFPTIKEMENFTEYIEKCEKTVNSGIFKIIPPKEYKPRKDNYINFDYKIPHPIEQIVSGEKGIYKVTLITHSARTYKKYAKCSNDNHVDNLSTCKIEELFWNSMKYSSPIYGSDSPGSIFDKGVLWNLNEIKNPLKDGLDYKIMSGITTPYLYFGCWRSMFCFHKEDMDLNSINYLHFGKPKFWYGIPDNESKKFDELMIKLFPNEYKECQEFLRHKNFIIHPSILKQNGIKIHKCIQNKGEFVITKSSAYHAGFNFGLNCAEAVNFITSNWIQKGIKAHPCKCQKGYVDIDINKFVMNLKKNLKNKDFIKNINKEDLKLIDKKNEENESDSEGEEIIKWIQCENISCKKWRRVSDTFKKMKKFECKDIKNTNCKTKEENWKKEYVILHKNIKTLKLRPLKRQNKRILRRK